MSDIEKKYQIFISSTYTDLIKAREEVTKVILNMYHIPIGMEMFSADNEDQWDTIKETIDSSDYYILIIGHRYGSETAEGISYTEKEFDYAKAVGIPVYAYIRKRDVATLPAERDKQADKYAKVEAFIEKATSNAMVEFWEEPADLGQKVSIAMPKAFRKTQRTGWVRADKAASPQILEELAILSKANRELREENDKLRTVTKKEPNLSVQLNSKETINLFLKEDFTTNKVLHRALYAYPYELSEDAHVFYQKTTVDEFNEWYDDNPDVVEKYNSDVLNHERSRQALTELRISIVNTGSAKANDINVGIIFPQGVKIYDSKNRFSILDIPYPDNAPEHPTKIALDAVNRRRRASADNNYYDRSSIDDENVTMIGNTVAIRIKSLIHTQKVELSSLYSVYIMPLHPGEFSTQVTIICEEYDKPIVIENPITVSME